MDEPTPIESAEDPSPLTSEGPTRGPAIAKTLLAACLVVLTGLVVGVFAWSALDSGASEERARTGPQIGDHWHASYAIYIGEQRQPNIPFWESGVHTHGDGIIHIHPFQTFEEGNGASLTKFFEYGGGVLTDAEIRIPGDPRSYLDGDQIPGEGSIGHIFIAATAAVESERGEDLGGGWARVSPVYIPHDGDRIMIFFSTEGAMRSLVASGDSLVPGPGVPTGTP